MKRTTTSLAKYLLTLAFLMLLAGCHKQPTDQPNLNRDAESAVIVIPGYYGTRLTEETNGDLIFISLGQALFGSQPLTLPIPGLNLEGALNLAPSSILDEVTIIPLLYSINVYRSLLDRLDLSSNKNRQIIPFSYDWRRDPMEAIHDLDALIHRLKKEGKTEISIVAHSMGGLIVSYYLRYGTQAMDSAIESWEGAGSLNRVILAGVPYLGVMHSLRNMNFGVTVGLNSSLLSVEAYSSFPSSYYTLPIFESDELLTLEGESLKGKIRNAAQWRQAEWGLLNTNRAIPKENLRRRVDYTSNWLRRSERFLILLQAPPITTSATKNQPSLLYIYGKGTPTMSKGVWLGDQTKGRASLVFRDYNSEENQTGNNATSHYSDGDGTVPVPSATLPAAFHKTLPTIIQEYDEVGHTELMSDPEILKAITTFLESNE